MTGFGSLVRLFWGDLARRRLVWALLFVLIGGVAVNFLTKSIVTGAMERGASYDLATKRAASSLDELASSLRPWLFVVVTLLGALVAPESRRNGTSQFVLAMGIRRDVLATAQFCALALLISAGVALLHVGFSIAGLRTGAIGIRDAALGWATLLLPLLLLASAVFALSLSFSSIETYLVFLGIPFVTQVLPQFMGAWVESAPLFVAHLKDNVGLLVPSFEALSPWPRASFGPTSGPPHPSLGWHAVHIVFATLFWLVLGFWRHRRHDFGSRTALK